MNRILTGAIGLGLLAASASLAQTHQTERLRGTIEKVDGNVLSLKLRDGRMATLRLADNFSTSVSIKMSLADIKPDSYIGTAAMPMPDGRLKALEIHIFPEAQRGAGEGFRAWDLQPKSTMTNAAVSGSVESADGRVLTLTYKGGEKKVLVPENTPIVTNRPGSRDDVKPGIGILVIAAEKLPDGTYAASRITVGRNGVNPPM
jgi:hypothetical protein